MYVVEIKGYQKDTDTYNNGVIRSLVCVIIMKEAINLSLTHLGDKGYLATITFTLSFHLFIKRWFKIYLHFSVMIPTLS